MLQIRRKAYKGSSTGAKPDNLSSGCTVINKNRKGGDEGIEPGLLWVHNLPFPSDPTDFIRFVQRNLNYI